MRFIPSPEGVQRGSLHREGGLYPNKRTAHYAKEGRQNKKKEIMSDVNRKQLKKGDKLQGREGTPKKSGEGNQVPCRNAFPGRRMGAEHPKKIQLR